MRTDEGRYREVAGPSDLPSDSGRSSLSRESPELGTLQASSLKTLRSQWASVYGIEPLPRLSRELLIRGIAYRMQERARGGLSRPVLRRLEQIVRSEQTSRGSSRSASARTGTRLMREWQGRMHEVIIFEDGFLWNGTTYRSLSEIARLITGTRWSGPRFFGLTDKGVAKLND